MSLIRLEIRRSSTKARKVNIVKFTLNVIFDIVIVTISAIGFYYFT